MQVREDFQRHYVAYKTQTNFVDLVPQKRRLLPTLNMRFDEVSDPRGLAADITNLGLWGTGVCVSVGWRERELGRCHTNRVTCCHQPPFFVFFIQCVYECVIETALKIAHC